MCKGYGLSDSSIEESDRVHSKMRKMLKNDDDDCMRSSNSEAPESIRSSEDYWQDLDGKLKKARTLTKEARKKQQEGRQI